jgi:hypothetical protein
MIRMAAEDVEALDRLVAAIADETKAAGTPPPTRGSVIRAAIFREIVARGLETPEADRSGTLGAAAKRRGGDVAGLGAPGPGRTGTPKPGTNRAPGPGLGTTDAAKKPRGQAT